VVRSGALRGSNPCGTTFFAQALCALNSSTRPPPLDPSSRCAARTPIDTTELLRAYCPMASFLSFPRHKAKLSDLMDAAAAALGAPPLIPLSLSTAAQGEGGSARGGARVEGGGGASAPLAVVVDSGSREGATSAPRPAARAPAPSSAADVLRAQLTSRAPQLAASAKAATAALARAAHVASELAAGGKGGAILGSGGGGGGSLAHRRAAPWSRGGAAGALLTGAALLFVLGAVAGVTVVIGAR
jgi:hypothetical protein